MHLNIRKLHNLNVKKKIKKNAINIKKYALQDGRKDYKKIVMTRL